MHDKAHELVLGLPRERVMAARHWKGILRGDVAPYLDLIAREADYRPRDEAERDPEWKQIIPYLLVRDSDRFFLMQRTAAGGDDRLHDLWSLGIGGHVNPEDGGVLEGLRREFHEEMLADWDPVPRLIGLLNDDDVLVGQVHLGVVFEADAAGRSLSVRERDKLRGGFATAPEVLRVYDHMETWSQLLYDHVTGRLGGPAAEA